MRYGESIPVVGDWLKITYIENPNMAFGLDLGGKLFLVIFSLLASIGIVYYLYRHRNAKLLLRLSLAMILAGALGNLVDRTFYGVRITSYNVCYTKLLRYAHRCRMP